MKKKSTKEETNQPEVVRKATYTFELTIMSDGKTHMKRINDGFNALELLGICNRASIEIIAQTKGEIKPDIIERQVIEDKKSLEKL